MKYGRLGLAIAIALATIPFGAMATPVAADVCPEFAAGHWAGTGFSNLAMASFTIDASVTLHPDSTTSGSYTVNGGSPIPFAGSIACTTGSFHTLDLSTIFGGATLSLDGRSLTGGTYSAPGDSGTWSLTADPYVLSATSTVQPTTISPGGASSWVFDVTNTGTAAATLVEADLSLTGAGDFGDLRNSSVSQGTGCRVDVEDSDLLRCDLGTILPGATANATVPVVSTGAAGSSIVLTGFASSTVGGGTDASADPVTISVVSSGSLPPGEVSGVVQSGATISTPGKPTPANPVVVKFKLPKRVKAGTTVALGRRRPRHHHASASGLLALVDGATRLVRRVTGDGDEAALRPASLLVKGPAVPMSISRSSTEAATFCGGAACSGDVIHLTSFSGYNDPKHPAKVTITWDASQRGRGVSSALYKRGDSATSSTRTLPACLKTAAGYLNTPCVSKKKQQASGDVQFTLLLLSGDPKFARR